MTGSGRRGRWGRSRPTERVGSSLCPENEHHDLPWLWSGFLPLPVTSPAMATLAVNPRTIAAAAMLRPNRAIRGRAIGSTSYGRGRSRHWHSARVGRPLTQGTPCRGTPPVAPATSPVDASWQRRSGSARRVDRLWCPGATPSTIAPRTRHRSHRRRIEPLLECQREVLRRSRMTRRFLGRVRARERKVGSLVPDDSPELGEGRPVREDPDHRRTIGRERALEAVAQPERRWRDDASRRTRSPPPGRRAPGTPPPARRGPSRHMPGSGWATRT